MKSRRLEGRQTRTVTNKRKERPTVFPLWLNLDEHLLLAHHLDHLTDITSRLLQQLELLTQQPHARIQRIPLGLESSEVLRSLVDRNFSLFDLVLVVALRGEGKMSARETPRYVRDAHLDGAC